MARQAYGKTWWGEQWLKALAHIDYDNRLPRGRSYANQGAVKELVVQGGTIQAKVKGSRARPYRITISVPPIPKKQIAGLLDRIAADPALIAGMLNRDLDPAMLTLAETLGIGVFPARWKDLAMHCSCPDWAVPCKHLAAVIYLLSREIDGNPFLVFSLRGIDLAEALQAWGILIEREADASLPEISDLLQSRGDGPAPATAQPAALDQIDFSTLPALAEPLLCVLPARPAFFSGGDFRATYQRSITRVAKVSRQTLAAAPPQAAKAAAGPFHPDDRPRIEIDGAYIARISGLAGIAGWPALVKALEGLAAAQLPDLQPELAALYHVRLMALHLLAQGAVVPQIFSLATPGFGLRWLPATLDAVVRDRLWRMAGGLPARIVMHREGRQAVPLPAESQANVLCSLFLDHFIGQWSGAEKEKPFGDKTIALFFTSGRACYDGPGEGSMAAGIRAWLVRFHLAYRDHSLLLCLDEAEGGDFSLTLAVEESAGQTEPVPLSSVLTDKAWAEARFSVLQTVALLAEFFPPLNDHVSAAAKAPIAIAAAALPSFLFDTLPVVRLLGIRILMPRALDQLLRPRLSMRVAGKTAGPSGMLKADDLFTFDWKVAVGDHLLSRAQFEKLVKNATGIIRFKGEYIYLDPNEINALSARLEQSPRLSGAELMRVALAGEYAGSMVGLDGAARRIIQELIEAGEVPLPRDINAELRPYQRRGYAWLYRNARVGFGSVIADDMGLGKTLQVIVTLQKLKEDGSLDDGQALVVVPTSLLTNWQKEIARFAPGLSVGVFHGAKRELTKNRPDVVLTSYGVARSEAASLKAMPWQVLVVDEAQNLKNPAAAQTKAVKAIPARCFVAMSGTPVENRLSKYWSILDFTNRGYLGSLSRFVKEYATPIQTHRDRQAAQRFKRIISDLPDKIEQDQYCTLTHAQTALYESVVQEGLRVIAGESEAFKRQGLVLQMILALKQICNHPAQYLKQGKNDAALSGKAERFLELVDDIHANHEKVLVFTQFREMGDLLCGWLMDRDRQAPLFLHGGVARAKRDAMVDRFQNDRTERVFILSLKAGGTGLNLTAASNVIHYDLWWNPAVEAQATDRAYRIGQQRNVQVHRFITRATFEERINDMIRAKRELAELTVGTGEKWIGNLGGDELKALFTLG